MLTALASGGASPRRSPAGAQAPSAPRGGGVIEPFPAAPRPQVERAEPVAVETAEPAVTDPRNPFARGRGTAEKPLRIFPYGVSRNRLHQAVLRERYPAVLVRDARDADIIVTLKNIFRRRPELLREAEVAGTPVMVSRSNSAAQLEDMLRTLFPNSGADDVLEEDDAPAEEPERANGDYELLEALNEAESAIMRVIEGGPAESLEPQATGIRRRQHELAERYNLRSRSRGKDPYRHVEIYRQGAQ
jgi:hypothetical protein